MSKMKIYVEDCIMQKDESVTAGSKILDGFISPFDAEIVENLTKAGMKIGKRLPMDEFGLDNYFSDNDEILSVVKEAAADKDVVVLCNDISGKIRRQAALKGLYYIKPAYGTVSRHGLVPVVASMDQIGVLCADLAKGFEVLEIIRDDDGNTEKIRIPQNQGECHCERSKANQNEKAKERHCEPPKEGLRSEAIQNEKERHCERSEAIQQQIRVAIPNNVWENDTSIIPELKEKFENIEMTLDYFDVYHQVLYILSTAEFSNNTNRYDGIKFGYRSPDSKNLNDLYINTRSECFTLNTKLNIIMGASVLSKENYESQYEKAMKLRRLINESVKFDTYDIIALPIEMKNKSKYEQSALYALTALTGLPSLTIPFGDSGVQLIAKTERYFNE